MRQVELWVHYKYNPTSKRTHIDHTDRSRVDGADSRELPSLGLLLPLKLDGVLTPRVVLKNPAFLLGGPADLPYSYLTLMIRFANSNHVSSSLSVRELCFLSFWYTTSSRVGALSCQFSGWCPLLPILGLVPSCQFSGWCPVARRVSTITPPLLRSPRIRPCASSALSSPSQETCGLSSPTHVERGERTTTPSC